MMSEDIINLFMYLLDIYLIVIIVKMLLVSKKIEVQMPMGYRWLVPSIFAILAIFGFFRYEGVFRYIQSGAVLAIAVMYWFIGTGLCPEGIVAMGRLIKWNEASPVEIHEDNCTLTYRNRKRTGTLFFKPENLNEVRSYASKYVPKLKKKKSS